MKSRLLITIGILVVIGSVTTILTMNFLDDKKTMIFDNTPEQLQAILNYCMVLTYMLQIPELHTVMAHITLTISVVNGWWNLVGMMNTLEMPLTISEYMETMTTEQLHLY